MTTEPRAWGIDGRCSNCTGTGHATWEIDACPVMEVLRKPEPLPEPTFTCFHCQQDKPLDDMRWTYPGHNLCVRCLRGGPPGLGDGTEEIVP